MMLIIYGPTATGKTALGLKLAKKYNGELVSADSRQVYKGLDIGTGKVSFASKVEKHQGFWIVDGIKIHGFDLANPGDQFTVADFLKFTSAVLFRINAANKLPIIVGGTGFYIKALIDGIESVGIKPDYKLRHKLEKLSVSDLYQQLLKLNSNRATKMNESDRVNPRRLIRAIEIALQTPNSKLQTPNSIGNWKLEIGNCLLVGLTSPNSYLYNRSDNWLKVRLYYGMIDEVRNLLDQKISPAWLENLGLEYRWLSRYLLGQITKEEAINRIKGDIHSFIRRQKTWFKKFPKIHLFDISKSNWQSKLAKII